MSGRGKYVAVDRMPEPRPPGTAEWYVSIETPRGLASGYDSEVVLWTDDRGRAVDEGERVARRDGLDLVVEGERVAGVEFEDEWSGNEWGWL